MKKIVSLFAFMAIMLSCQFIYGQSLYFGLPEAVISVPNLSARGSQNNPLNAGYNSRFGPDEGIFGEYHLSSFFSLRPCWNILHKVERKTECKHSQITGIHSSLSLCRF